MARWLRAVILGALGTALAGAVSCSGAESVSSAVVGKDCVFYYAGGGWPDPPQGSTLCGKGVCSYQLQAGCAVGQTCAPHLDTASNTIIPACRAGGTQQKGQACDSASPDRTKQCAAGLLCAEKACRDVCCGGDWSACAPGESCFHQANMYDNNQVSTYTEADLCFPIGTCDVLDPKACSDVGQTCRIVDPRGAVACTPRTTLTLGDPCSKPSQCGPGQQCVGSGDSVADESGSIAGACRRLCRWACEGEPSCPADEGVCVHFDRDPEGVGECTPDWHGKPIVVDGGLVPGFLLDGGIPTLGRTDRRRARDAGKD